MTTKTRSVWTLLACVALAALPGCKNWFSGDDRLPPPSGFSYPSPQVYTVGTPITPLAPTVTGRVDIYTLGGPLPAGLSLDAHTGAISGTPTTASAQASYGVTAANSSGGAIFPLVITVNPVAPSALSYASPQSWQAGTAITPISPTVTGTVTGYAVTPALPAGVTINATSGIISGTPTGAAAQATYTITASNGGGSTQFALVATVAAAAAPAATLHVQPMIESTGDAVIALRDDGAVWAWASNRTGALGQGCSAPNAASPIQVKGVGGTGLLTGIVQISAGYEHVLALRSDGTVLIWGKDASYAAALTGGADQCLPAQVVDIGGTGVLSHVVKVSAGMLADAALLDTGELVTWGQDTVGAAGQPQGTGVTYSNTPHKVAGIAGAIDVSMNLRGGFAVNAAGTLYAWGSPSALGNGTTQNTTQYGPVAVASNVVRVSAAQDTYTALMTDGTVRTWGWNVVNGSTPTPCGNGASGYVLSLAQPAAPGASATAYNGVSSAYRSGLFLYNGGVYSLNDPIDPIPGANFGTGTCAGAPYLLRQGMVGMSRSQASQVFMWDAAGTVWGYGANSSGQLLQGDTASHDGGVQIPGFSLFTALPAGTVVFQTDFESGLVSQVAPGSALITGVQGYAGLGTAGNQFTGSFLRSATLNTVTITLTNLPAHTKISLDMLFAAIDSLDGYGSFPAGDFLNIGLDGTSIFREAFANATPTQVQTYIAPPGVTLARRVDLGFQGPGGFYTDSAYDFGKDARFHGIPHTGSTATFTFVIEGAGAQSLTDESWAMDNLKVTVY